MRYVTVIFNILDRMKKNRACLGGVLCGNQFSQVLADQFGAYYNIKEKKQKFLGGEVNETWLITDGIQPVFVKVNERSYRSMFRAEADQLNLLDKTNTIRLPQVYGVGCSQNHSFLLLEALPISQQTNVTPHFAEELAKLHQSIWH